MKSLFAIIFSLMFIISCTQEYAVIHPDTTRVVVDSLIQPDPVDFLDVLIVLDRSGSMHGDVASVGIGMEILKTDIDSIIPDYRFLFITADPDSTSFVGPLDNTSSALDFALAPTLLANSNGEDGFAAAYNFLQKDDFFSRDYADLLLFFVSDEDEQSGLTPELTREWLIDFKGGSQVDVISIVATDSDCGEVGHKYMKISELFGKPAIDICTESWENWLSDSSFLINLKDYIELSETPVPGSISVYVDKMGTYDWYYDEDENAVHFDFEPLHGSFIEVGYKVIDETVL